MDKNVAIYLIYLQILIVMNLTKYHVLEEMMTVYVLIVIYVRMLGVNTNVLNQLLLWNVLKQQMDRGYVMTNKYV